VLADLSRKDILKLNWKKVEELQTKQKMIDLAEE
jgi:hypothetical protein